MPQKPVYDRIGGAYGSGRQEDPRLATLLRAVLGDASPVLNVGAGVGSYEPRDRPVVAVEPSSVMLSQRPPDAAPAVQAVAEVLPFRDGAFGVATGLFTVHHWRDRARGLAEMRRVSHGPVVLFLRDPHIAPDWWLHHYFPAVARLEASRHTPLAQIAQMMDRQLEVTPAPIPADCTDGFSAAYWRRPQAYLNSQIWSSMSALALISDTDREQGMRRLQSDLDSGKWHRRWGHLLALDKLDLGYRIVVARP